MLYGIQSGMVMQRGDDERCCVWFTSDEPITDARCLNDAQSLTVVSEGNRRYRLEGLLAGGPYQLAIGSETLHDVYVGDVWLLAGQSNMQGIGRTDRDVPRNTNPQIRAFYMYGQWDIADHPLHEMGRAVHGVHAKINPGREILHTRLVGPGIAFARRMHELTGVPQGLICCAHGGTSLAQWSAERKEQGPDNSLYAAMLERFHSNGSHVKGLFWYQGCNEVHAPARDTFTQRMTDFVHAVRADVGDIPIVQTQIARFSYPGTPIADPDWFNWTSIRSQQLEISRMLPQMDTVHTIGLEMADDIHLEGLSLENLGASAAESMFCLLHGRLYGCMPGIQLASAECFADDAMERVTTVVLAYDNVHGQLDRGSRPQGYAFSHSKDGDFYRPFQVRVDGQYVYVKVNRPIDEVRNSYLWYGIGHDPACNILDSRGRSLPAFGPVALKDQ